MINKYLQLLRKAIESFNHLGRGNSWSDYFQTVGLECLVLLIGIATIAGIILVLFAPYKGTTGIKMLMQKRLRKYDKVKEFLNEYKKDVADVKNNIYRITSDLIPSYISEITRITQATYISSDRRKEQRKDIEEKYLYQYNENMAFCRNLLDKYNMFDNDKIKEAFKMFENIKGFDIYTINNVIKKFTDEFNKYNPNGINKKENPAFTIYIASALKDKFGVGYSLTEINKAEKKNKIYTNCLLGTFYVLYAIMVVPLIMMLF